MLVCSLCQAQTVCPLGCMCHQPAEWETEELSLCKTPDFHRKPESLYHRDSPWISGYRVQNVSQTDTQSHTSHLIKIRVH
jgi:hypothetical protein